MRIYSGFQDLQIARHPSTLLAMEPVGLLSEAGQMLVWSSYDHVTEMEVSVWGIRHLVGILLSFQFIFRFCPHALSVSKLAKPVFF